MIRYRCPMCKKALTATEAEAGAKLDCPQCGQRLQVPKPPPNKTMLGELEEPSNKTVLGEPESGIAPADPQPRYKTDPPPVRMKNHAAPATPFLETPAEQNVPEDADEPSYEDPRDSPEEEPDPFSPSYRRKPGKVQAIAIMILVGGIIACVKFFILDILLAFHTMGLFCVPGIYSLVLGILAILKGSQLIGDKGHRQPPPTAIAVMMIINIVAFDIANLVMGILILVFLNEYEVREYYRS
jgi:DNA-directed RNA polymerase subunit RPC12/RpoP